MKLEKDTTISHYKILSEIGKGGIGEFHGTKGECVRSLTVKEGFRSKIGLFWVNSLVF